MYQRLVPYHASTMYQKCTIMYIPKHVSCTKSVPYHASTMYQNLYHNIQSCTSNKYQHTKNSLNMHQYQPINVPHTCAKDMPHTMHLRCASTKYQRMCLIHMPPYTKSIPQPTSQRCVYNNHDIYQTRYKGIPLTMYHDITQPCSQDVPQCICPNIQTMPQACTKTQPLKHM
jgi:hypothetical protein